MHLPVVISDQTNKQVESNKYLVTLTASSTGWNVHVEAVCSGAHWEAHLLSLATQSKHLALVQTLLLFYCNVSSAWRDQMSSSDSVATQMRTLASRVTEHVCGNYSHVASQSWLSLRKWSSTHTHTHTSTHSLTHRNVLLFLAQLPPLFQHEFRWRMIVSNITDSNT